MTRRPTPRPPFDHPGNAVALANAQHAVSTALRQVSASYSPSSHLAELARRADRAVSLLRWELDRACLAETGLPADYSEEDHS